MKTAAQGTAAKPLSAVHRPAAQPEGLDQSDGGDRRGKSSDGERADRGERRTGHCEQRQTGADPKRIARDVQEDGGPRPDGAGGASPLRSKFEEALRQPGVAAALAVAGQPRQRAVVPVVIEAAGQRSNWITTVTTFGAPQDAFVEELTIEQFFPAAVAREPDLSRAPGGRAVRARRSR